MKTNIARLLCALTALGVGSVAHAGFINGGFETGNFTGWTVEHATYNGNGNLATQAYTPLALPSPHANVIGNVVDPFSPFDTVASIGDGNFMARLNQVSTPLTDVTRIRQTATMLVGETDLFINWGAVMEDPQHSVNDQPEFLIEIRKNAVVVATENHNASQGATGGWTPGPIGPDGSPTFHNSGQFHLAGLLPGDIIEVSLAVADCALSGHVGYAYLDGIGNIQTPPPGSNTPDTGSTIALLIPALLGLAAFRRRK